MKEGPEKYYRHTAQMLRNASNPQTGLASRLALGTFGVAGAGLLDIAKIIPRGTRDAAIRTLDYGTDEAGSIFRYGATVGSALSSFAIRTTAATPWHLTVGSIQTLTGTLVRNTVGWLSSGANNWGANKVSNGVNRFYEGTVINTVTAGKELASTFIQSTPQYLCESLAAKMRALLPNVLGTTADSIERFGATIGPATRDIAESGFTPGPFKSFMKKIPPAANDNHEPFEQQRAA